MLRKIIYNHRERVHYTCVKSYLLKTYYVLENYFKPITKKPMTLSYLKIVEFLLP